MLVAVWIHHNFVAACVKVYDHRELSTLRGSQEQRYSSQEWTL